MKSLWNNRRAFVAGLYASLFLVVVLLAGKHSGAAFPLITIYLVCASRLAIFSKPYGLDGRYWRVPAHLDERQSQVRDHALAHSYWVTYTSVGALTAWVLMAPWWGLWAPSSSREWLMVLWLVTTFTSMLPASIVAWNERPE